MKKYTSRATKWLGIATFIFGAGFLTGMILAFANVENIGLPIGLILMGGSLSVLFLICYFADKSRSLIIDADTITFPRGIEKNGKTVFQKTVVKISEINSVESKFHKGDWIISGDCFFYTIKLKDGTSITFTLYAYGKEAEKEIIQTIKRSVV